LAVTVVWVSTDRLRLLILIVAYNAESTLAPVLDRLPAAVLSDYDCEVLVIDNAWDRLHFEPVCTTFGVNSPSPAWR